MDDDTNRFDISEYKCPKFLTGLNKCNTKDEVISYVDGIVDDLSTADVPKRIGTSGFFSTGNVYLNDGKYTGFITPSIKISSSNIGYCYHIYDRDYLYSFALGIRGRNLPTDTSLFPYVMPYLDFYFGFPKDGIDRREDVLYNYALNHAEEFYANHPNIHRYENDATCAQQMQISGEFPISAFKGTFTAQCSERATLAQNILKMCGYNSVVMYGDCKSDGISGGHAWNGLIDKSNNLFLMDFSYTTSSFDNDKFLGRVPFYCSVSSEYLMNHDEVIEVADYHYENGEQIIEDTKRVYAVGKSMTNNNEYKPSNKR